MLLVACPWCGKRDESEFVCLGEQRPARPEPPPSDDNAWRAYLLDRNNVRGEHIEVWWHAKGCGERFALVRDTVTHATRPFDGRQD